MLRYAIQRLLWMIPTLLGVAVVVFVLLRMLPGDIVELRFLIDGGQASPEAIAAERVRLGLDKPLWWQFIDWMTGIFVGNFGISMWTGRPVIDEIVPPGADIMGAEPWHPPGLSRNARRRPR